jgi:NAD(P)-dependent dehydrogenase (short-subunit alcohol dehydrogenase family)
MRTVAIVGDSRGIGAALREQLLGQGVRVVGVSRTGVQRVGGEHPNYQSLVFDAVAHPCDLSGFVDALDGLVYCPGTIKLKPLRGLKREQFLEDFEVNVLGAVQTLQANHKLLQAGAANGAKPGVVLFSTVAVQTGMAYHASIAAAKGAVEGLVRTLAAEWAPEVRVNAVAPSLTDTSLAASLLGSDAKREAAAERHPLNKVLTAEEVASAAAYLVSEHAAGITGQVLHVDAGMGGVR